MSSKRVSRTAIMWRISRISGAKAEQLGVARAPDPKATIKIAIKESAVTNPEHQSRLAARPDA